MLHSLKLNRYYSALLYVRRFICILWNGGTKPASFQEEIKSCPVKIPGQQFIYKYGGEGWDRTNDLYDVNVAL
jgi:hypothetical protein